MLEAIRKYTGSFVVKLLFVFLILSFGVWGIADVFRPGGGRDWAMRVGDVTIPPQTGPRGLSARVAPATRDRRRHGQCGNGARVRAAEPGHRQHRFADPARSRAWAARTSSSATRPCALRCRPTRRFRGPRAPSIPTSFAASFSSTALSEDGFAELVRGDIARRKLVSAVTAGAACRKTMVEAIFQAARREAGRRLRLRAERRRRRPSASRTRRRLQAFYEAHPERFSAPEYRAASARRPLGAGRRPRR